jgi:hypothetical protein
VLFHDLACVKPERYYCCLHMHAVTGAIFDVVDSFNGDTGAWTTAQLSFARSSLAAASLGSISIFAGGSNWGVFWHKDEILEREFLMFKISPRSLVYLFSYFLLLVCLLVCLFVCLFVCFFVCLFVLMCVLCCAVPCLGLCSPREVLLSSHARRRSFFNDH